jgi:hypothetical protein
VVWLGWLAFASWILMTVDGLLPQAQAMMLEGRVLIPNIALKFVFLASLLACALCGRHLSVPWRLRTAYYLFIAYLGIDALILFLFWPPHSFEYILFGYNAYFFFLVAIGLFALTGQTLRESALARSTLLIFLPLGMLGVAQHITGLPLLPVVAGDELYGYAAMSYTFFGQMRAFSLFADPWEFGTFVSLVACITLSQSLFSRGRRRFFWFAAFAATQLAIYCTLTRMIYVEALLGSASVVLIWRACSVRWSGLSLKWLPIAYGVFTTIFAFYVGPVIGSVSGSLTNSDSLIDRLYTWSRYFHIWTSGSLGRFLFGTGMIQNGRFAFSRDMVIDNTSLGIAIQIGFVGLVLWVYLMWRIWRYLLAETLCLPSALRVGFTGFFSTWLAAGTFAIVIGQFAVIAWLYIATIPYRRASPAGT